MRKTFKFVKLAQSWFYWWPEYEGDPGDLAMVDGADELLDSLGKDMVTLQTVSPEVAEIILSKLEEDEFGATYVCRSETYSGKVWICAVTLAVLGEYPQIIYLALL